MEMYAGMVVVMCLIRSGNVYQQMPNKAPIYLDCELLYQVSGDACVFI
jgi:hypothetical protein